MGKIGLVGGIGPASTIDYYNGLIRGYRRRTGLDAYPEIVVNSVDMTEMLSYVAAEEWEDLSSFLLRAVEDLLGAGASIAALASNTPHVVFDRIRGKSPLPLVSIVDAACRRAAQQKLRRVLLLGTLFTMRADFYPRGFAEHGIETVVPPPAQQQEVQDIIFPELEEGIVVPAKKRRLIEIANALIERHSLDGVVLGCTELPLMAAQKDFAVAVLDTAQIHVEAILDAWMGTQGGDGK